MAEYKLIDASTMLDADCSELTALNLLKENSDISIRELQGRSGLNYNQASILKKAYSGGNPALLEQTIAKIIQQSLESISALKIVQAKLNEHYRFEVADDRPIGVAALFDLHCGGYGVAHDAMRGDFEIIKQTDGLYTLLGGDYTDNFIKSSMTSAILESTLTPQQQLEIFGNMLSIVESKIVAIISGNHDLWTKYLSGIDVIRAICESKRLAYAPHQLRVQVALPGREYALGIRHQARYNSAKNPAHAITTWRKEITDWPFDVGFVGHTHTAQVATFTHESKEHLAIRPGTYKVLDDFSQRFGFPTSLPVMPVVILYPNERRMLAFSDIRSGAEVLTALRAMPLTTRKTFYAEIKPMDIVVVKSSELGDNHSKPPKRKKGVKVQKKLKRKK